MKTEEVSDSVEEKSIIPSQKKLIVNGMISRKNKYHGNHGFME